MDKATLAILRDTSSGDVYVAYSDGESGEVITATRPLHYSEVERVYRYHAAGNDNPDSEFDPCWMDCGDARYLSARDLRPAFLEEFTA